MTYKPALLVCAILLAAPLAFSQTMTFKATAQIVTLQWLGHLGYAQISNELCFLVLYNKSDLEREFRLDSPDFFPKNFKISSKDFQYVRCRGSEAESGIFDGFSGVYLGQISYSQKSELQN